MINLNGDILRLKTPGLRFNSLIAFGHASVVAHVEVRGLRQRKSCEDLLGVRILEHGGVEGHVERADGLQGAAINEPVSPGDLERVKVAPKPGAKVVDATGAGDSFNGAYLSARLAGKSLREAAEEGHRVAGVVIGQKGALVDPKFLAE